MYAVKPFFLSIIMIQRVLLHSRDRFLYPTSRPSINLECTCIFTHTWIEFPVMKFRQFIAIKKSPPINPTATDTIIMVSMWRWNHDGSMISSFCFLGRRFFPRCFLSNHSSSSCTDEKTTSEWSQIRDITPSIWRAANTFQLKHRLQAVGFCYWTILNHANQGKKWEGNEARQVKNDTLFFLLSMPALLTARRSILICIIHICVFALNAMKRKRLLRVKLK